MGMYDNFIYKCPNCGKDTISQTKLGECAMSALTIGCEFLHDGKILMKDPCEHCGEYNTVIIEDTIIQEFGKENIAIFKELQWGSCEKIEREDKTNG